MAKREWLALNKVVACKELFQCAPTISSCGLCVHGHRHTFLSTTQTFLWEHRCCHIHFCCTIIMSAATRPSQICSTFLWQHPLWTEEVTLTCFWLQTSAGSNKHIHTERCAVIRTFVGSLTCRHTKMAIYQKDGSCFSKRLTGQLYWLQSGKLNYY